MESAMKSTTIVLVAVCFCVMAVLSAEAGTVTVTNTNDSGPGSIRQAIADALPGDEIVYTSIHDAVDNASPGDTLPPEFETFCENVVAEPSG